MGDHPRSTRQAKLGVLLAACLLPLSTIAGAHAAGATVAPAQTEGPNLVANGGFERGFDPGRFFVFPTGDTSSLLQGWTLLNAGLDKFRPGVVYVGSYVPCEEGKRCIELGGGGEIKGNIGGIKQTFATTAGQVYQLSFYQSADVYDANPRAVRVTVAGQSRTYNYMPQPAELQNPQKMRWIQRSFTFTASATATSLEFDSALAAPGGKGSLVDNVQVRAMLSSVQASLTPAAGGQTVASSTFTVQAASATIAAGGTQTVQGTATAGCTVALIVDYAGGSQLETHTKADATGKYSYSWAVPDGIHGTVHVLADAAGSIGQVTFSVS